MSRWFGRWFGSRWFGRWFGSSAAAPAPDTSTALEVSGALASHAIDGRIDAPTLAGVHLHGTMSAPGTLAFATVSGVVGPESVSGKLPDERIDATVGGAKPAINGSSVTLEAKTKWTS